MVSDNSIRIPDSYRMLSTSRGQPDIPDFLIMPSVGSSNSTGRFSLVLSGISNPSIRTQIGLGGGLGVLGLSYAYYQYRQKTK